jgi:predicted nuclease with TOPRIM domain
MAFPGISALEIVKIIAKAKEVYEAFADDYQNAPNRIKELADTIKYLHDILEELRIQLETYRADYPGSNSFAKKLQECEAFVQRYSELRPVEYSEPSSSRSRLSHAARRVWQTTRWAFADATQLKEGLSQEMLKLNTFILVFAL